MSIADALLGWIGQGLIFGTGLALLTWIATKTVLRNARPALHVALWTIVLLKFLIPFGPSAPFSLTGWLGRSWLSASRAVPDVDLTAINLDAALPSAASTTLTGWNIVAVILAVLYVACVAVLATRRLFHARRSLRRARALPCAPSSVRHQVEACARLIGLRRVPRAVLCADHESPFVVGGSDSVVAVPAWLSRQDCELRAVLLHELAHLRRGDQWLRVLESLVCVCFFFWPVVSAVRRATDTARERACDQWAVHKGGIRSADFARTLLMVARRSHYAGAFVMSLARRQSVLELRVRDLVSGRGKRPELGIAFFVLALAWGGVALAGPETEGELSPDALLCATDPRIGVRILATNPDADVDGDGVLSKKEVCAHQLRMKTRLVGRAASKQDALSRRIDADGDGQLSDDEILAFAEIVVIEVDRASKSKVVFHLTDSGSSTELEELSSVETTAVSGTVCEPSVGSCVAKRVVPAEPAQSLLLIDVAAGP